MPNKIELNTLTQVNNNETRFLVALNDNLKRIQEAINDTLSRTGIAPNQMEQVLDMNGNSIVNVVSGSGQNDVVTRKDIQGIIDEANDAISKVWTLVQEAQSVLDQYSKGVIAEADAAKNEAILAKEAAISAKDTAVASATSAGTSELNANTWAEGSDSAVEALGGAHSSKVSAQLAQAYANADYGETVEDYASTHEVIVQGEKGEPGVSPLVSVSTSGPYITISVTDASGTKTTQITAATIDDTTTAPSKTWSSSKIDNLIGDVEALIEAL